MGVAPPRGCVARVRALTQEVRERWGGVLGPVVGLALFGVALWVLHDELRHVHLREVLATLEALAWWRVAAALGFCALSYGALTFYDYLTLWYLGHGARYRDVWWASAISYAVTNSSGHQIVVGSALRYRLYAAWGLSATESVKIAAVVGLSFWLGIAVTGGMAVLMSAGEAPARWPLAARPSVALGVALLAGIAGYIGFCAWGKRRAVAKGWRVRLPGAGLAAAQTVVSTVDVGASALVLYMLLPEGSVSFWPFALAFVSAATVGALSQIPGGLGAFEAVIVILLGGRVEGAVVAGSLAAYRGVYNLLPLTVAAAGLGGIELARRREGIQRVAEPVARLARGMAPNLIAAATFVGGAVLLLSGALPAEHERFAWLRTVVPLAVIELSHLAASIVGAVLLVLARGLQRRLDGAFVLTGGLLGAGIVLSLLKGLDWEEALILSVLLGALLASRREFDRRSSLWREPLSGGWLLAMAVVVGSAVWLVLFSYKHVDYTNELWWRFALSGHAPRSMRATAGAAGVLLVGALAWLLRPAAPEPRLPGTVELDKAAELARKSRWANAHLALVGDKTLLFSDGGEAMLMFAVRGRTWAVMGDAVGREEEFAGLLWRFRELVDRHGGRPAFWEVRAEELYRYVDMGLTAMKVGEEAMVDLREFSLEGKERRSLRHSHHRAAGAGLSFEVVTGREAAALMPKLRTISQAWLAEKHAAEKRFSVGYFDEGYLARTPVAVVRQGGEVVGFANLWPGAEQFELSVDLMRHARQATGGIMDFLFAELMLWGKSQGYEWFNLGMTPLSGLERHELAQLWSRVGAWVFAHGEHFYNFQGLRRFKEKFMPQWRGRYLACPGGLAVAGVLADVLALIGGGWLGAMGAGQPNEAKGRVRRQKPGAGAMDSGAN